MNAAPEQLGTGTEPPGPRSLLDRYRLLGWDAAAFLALVALVVAFAPPFFLDGWTPRMAILLLVGPVGLAPAVQGPGVNALVRVDHPDLEEPRFVAVDLGRPGEGGGDVLDRWNGGAAILRAPYFGQGTRYSLVGLDQATDAATAGPHPALPCGSCVPGRLGWSIRKG